jgi:hypothetical protein
VVGKQREAGDDGPHRNRWGKGGQRDFQGRRCLSLPEAGQVGSLEGGEGSGTLD